MKSSSTDGKKEPDLVAMQIRKDTKEKWQLSLIFQDGSVIKSQKFDTVQAAIDELDTKKKEIFQL